MEAEVAVFDLLSELDDVLDAIFANDDPIRKQGTFLKLVLSDTAVINHSIIWGLILMATGSIGFSTVLSGLVLQDLL